MTSHSTGILPIAEMDRRVRLFLAFIYHLFILNTIVLTTRRFALLRQLDQLIQQRETGNSHALADRLGIARSTLFQYIALLKELGAPIEYDRLTSTFYYADRGTFNFGFKKKLFQ